jgi:hypothetical protein
VLAAFGVLLYAGIRIALRAPDPFGRLLATGITSWLGLQIIINLGARFIRHDAAGRTEQQPRDLVIGPTTRHMSIAPTGSIRLVGIRFAPGGAVPFLSVPPKDVRCRARARGRRSTLEDDAVDRLAAASYGTESAILDAALGQTVGSRAAAR